jgi:mannitol-specific phosphotransferase system IIBC component
VGLVEFDETATILSNLTHNADAVLAAASTSTRAARSGLIIERMKIRRKIKAKNYQNLLNTIHQLTNIIGCT